MLRRSRVYLRQVVNLMARRPDLLCGAILLSVLLVLAVKFTCGRAKHVVAQAPPPVRFFSTDAPVVDLYLGQVDQLGRLRALADVSVVIFYAPWCAHSMVARDQLQHVAHRLGKEVLFVAINCWWNQGKCRRQKNFYQYPIIHIYYRRFGPIEYKGPITAQYVERFIQKVITPLTYLPSQATLKDFLAYHEPGVVGFFQFNSSPQPPGYITFLSSALQALKKDFQGVVRFGVVTNKDVAEAISVLEDETVYLHRHFNSSLIFPRWERNFTAESICSWVFQHRESLLPWVGPTGAKSRSLEQELLKGPALLLFLPHDPLAPNHPLLDQIADVAVRYHSCAEDLLSQVPQDGVGFPQRPLCCNTLVLPGWSSVSGSDQNVCELCLNRSVKPSVAEEVTKSLGPASVEGLGIGAVHSVSQRCSVVELEAVLETYLRHLSASGDRITPHAYGHSSPLLAPTCSNVRNAYSPFSHYSACCRPLLSNNGNHTHPMEKSMEQPLSGKPLSNASSEANKTTEKDCFLTDRMMGLRCRTNKTLRFYLLDSHLHWELATRLGATRNESKSDQTFVAIVDLQDETHYVLDHRGGFKESIEPFIQNFSTPHSHLKRHLIGGKRPQMPQSLIQEVTTETFLDIAMDPKRDVLLLYYTNWCGFCTVLNHVLIQLARLLQSNGRFTVARVNVASNDLPWEFMVDHFPSILLFPRHKKHLSLKYPDDSPFTLPNLLRFVLTHIADDPYPQPSASSHSPPSSSSSSSNSSPASSMRGSLLEAEVLALRGELRVLRQARGRLSAQLAGVWRERRTLALQARQLVAENGELRRRGDELEELRREKSRELAGTVRRLQELADASRGLLAENAVLKVLLTAMKEGGEAGGEREKDSIEEEEEEDGLGREERDKTTIEFIEEPDIEEGDGGWSEEEKGKEIKGQTWGTHREEMPHDEK